VICFIELAICLIKEEQKGQFGGLDEKTFIHFLPQKFSLDSSYSYISQGSYQSHQNYGDS